jgi:hypothetical protein
MITGMHELVGNALVMKGETPRSIDLRQEDLEFPDASPEEDETQGQEEGEERHVS